MGDLRIDYSDLSELTRPKSGGPGDGGSARGGASAEGPVRRLLLLTVRGPLLCVVLAILPFVLLIRGGVFAYQAWGLGTWPALFLSTVASAALLGLYAWGVSHRLGASRGVRTVFSRAAIAVGIAYVCYALVFVASENVKSSDVRDEYASIHPLLRIAASALILVDPSSVIPDAGRTPEDYWLMGLSRNEASLHFEQPTGYVHALDLRTLRRPEWRNRGVELAFWALGFNSMRHVGTADHLHVSLRVPS